MVKTGAIESVAKKESQKKSPEKYLPKSIGTKILVFSANDELEALEMLKAYTNEQTKLEATGNEISFTIQDNTLVNDLTRLEKLHDSLVEVLGNVNTVRDSYESIIKSLCTLQQRPRARRKSASLVPTSKLNIKGYRPESLDSKQQVLEKFLNPASRTQAFAALFRRADQLKTLLDPFCRCFDAAGSLLEDRYAEHSLIEDEVNFYQGEVNALAKVVDAILRKYNSDVLELFRLSKSSVPRS